MSDRRNGRLRQGTCVRETIWWSVAEMANSIKGKPTADSKWTLLQPATVHESWSWVLTQSNRGPKTYGARQGPATTRSLAGGRRSRLRSPSHWAPSEEAAVAEGALLGSYDYGRSAPSRPQVALSAPQ